ncbi:MAG: hypothetical protein KAU01_07485 [Candidatus Cloacimonetes bacterium]|nr:hypothetical protein [Candidatus Cloacimonadota bacterium]
MKLSIIFLSVLILTACVANKQLTTLQREPNESIIVGKIKVLYNGNDVTDKSYLCFNERATGKYDYKPDSTGYIITKLPVGDGFLSRITYTNIIYNLPKDMALFHVSDSNKIHYIGDLTVNWVGPKSKISGMFGLVGAIIDELNNDGDLEVYAINNQNETMKYFYNKFQTDMEVENIVLNVPHPDSLSHHKIFAEINDNPNLLSFNLKKNKSCKGLLRMIKKETIFVEQGKKLYVFKQKNLISIIDQDGNDVTEEILQQTDFKRINFNRYEVIHL